MDPRCVAVEQDAAVTNRFVAPTKFGSLALYPGMPATAFVPRELCLIVAPRFPIDVETTDSLKLSQIPGISFTNRRNRKLTLFCSVG